jgi:signal transduction histidine kinase
MGRPINFTVDARLLQELGERLVGRPHIALGELIKNAYDADASAVVIRFDDDSIEIADNGHGMSEEAFIARWMRIGTTHKAREHLSPRLGRPLTGSKGVGRLAAQLLAKDLEIVSTALADQGSRPSDTVELERGIKASIRWAEAIQQQELTSVTVDFDEAPPSQKYVGESPHGTLIRLTGLLNEWGSEEFRGLAQEIWALQPPFEEEGARQFEITLITPHEDVQRSFDRQMSALLDIASATLSGRLLPLGDEGPSNAERIVLDLADHKDDEDGELEAEDSDAREPRLLDPDRYAELTLDLVGYPSRIYVVQIPDCQIDNFDFHVRVFDLVHRQPLGIRVGEARKYLADFGGVHLYDNGFRLPYYGPDNDWLRLELDHARRLSRSRLLPAELQVSNAMQDLPSNKRVYGAVNISTSHEQRAASESGRDTSRALAIQISRDRLSDNLAFKQVARTVRVGIDLYAIARAQSKVRRILERPRPARQSASIAVTQAASVLESLREEIPRESYDTLRETIDTVAGELTARDSEARAYASLLGSLATAGMTSLAYEHEVAAQRGKIDQVAKNLEAIAQRTGEKEAAELRLLATSLQDWGHRSERIRALFRPLLDEEDRTQIGRYRARAVIDDVAETLGVIARRTSVDPSHVPAELKLPPATYAAWSAVVQNILMNAFRATLESRPGRILVDGGGDDAAGYVRFQDNGHGGVDLKHADRLFMPFQRASEISERAMALGLGGSGLGLTIVKMITDEVGCQVGFEEPDQGWSTAIRIRWGK